MTFTILTATLMGVFALVAPGIFSNVTFLSFTCVVVGYVSGVAIAAAAQQAAFTDIVADEEKKANIYKFKV